VTLDRRYLARAPSVVRGLEAAVGIRNDAVFVETYLNEIQGYKLEAERIALAERRFLAGIAAETADEPVLVGSDHPAAESLPIAPTLPSGALVSESGTVRRRRLKDGYGWRQTYPSATGDHIQVL
jgi:hypothetical protein